MCIFSILNWFYPYQNWGISAEKALSFNLINKGSEILIEEFPSSEDFIDTKEKLKKFKLDKLREECGVFGISNHSDASALVALGLHALQHRGQEGCGIVSFDGKNYHSEKRQGLVGDHFTNQDTLKNSLEILQLDIIDILLRVKLHLEIFNLFLQIYIWEA